MDLSAYVPRLPNQFRATYFAMGAAGKEVPGHSGIKVLLGHAR